MNKLRHTPGPWKIEPVFIAQQTCEALHFGEYRFPNATQTTDGVQHSKTYCREEAEANARLMSAAPELLEACKSFIQKLESGEIVRDISRDAERDWPMRMMYFTASLQKAVSAVEKAERA